MHLRMMKVFCDVVSRQSFSRAADENDMSQSGASQLVHQLEEHLGVKLIDRSKRPFVLTAEGEVYYEGCRSIVQNYQSLEEKIRNMHREVSGRLRVASIYSVGLHSMSRHLQMFMTRYAQANVRLEYLHPDRVYQAVERGTADLGLVSYPKSSRTIQAIDWRREPMVLACAPEHRFAQRTSVSLAELNHLDVVTFDPNLTIRRELDKVLNQQHVTVHVAMEFDNIETLKRAIEINAGVGILPAPTIAQEVETGSLHSVRLSDVELFRPLGIIHRRGMELSVTAQCFIDLLRAEETERRESPAESPAAAVGITPAAGSNAEFAAERKRKSDRAIAVGAAGQV